MAEHNDVCVWNVGALQGTFPEPLQPAANSVLCTTTDDSSLLRAVFNKTAHFEHPISFPPSRCRTAISRCQQCLAQAHCRHHHGLFKSYCSCFITVIMPGAGSCGIDAIRFLDGWRERRLSRALVSSDFFLFVYVQFLQRGFVL